MLGVKARIILVAAGLGFSLLETGCRSQSSPEATGRLTETLPASAAGMSTSGFTAESATLDGGADADAGPNCAAAGDPTLGVDAGSSCTGALAQATFTYGLCACTTLQASNSLTTDGFDSTKGAPDGGLGERRRQYGRVVVDGLDHRRQSLDARQRHLVQSQRRARGSTPRWHACRRRDVHRRRQRLRRQYAACQRQGPGKISKVSSVAAPCDCSNLVPVASITAAHRTTNNDDGTIGLSPTVAVGNNPARINLPCGNYYLSQINAAQPLTIAIHGHTALYVDGNLNASGDLAIQMNPTATLDLFVAGTFNASNGLALGSTSDPAHCRAYVAGTTFNVSGSTTVGCNIYAPQAQVILGNGSTTFGSIFGKSIQANGNATLHYDTSVASAGGECCSAGTCDDGNPCTVDACNGDGTCSHTAAANGATCTGTNKCDQAYSCQAGACVGIEPGHLRRERRMPCRRDVQSRERRMSNPDAPNGTSCNDGNACTQSDTCQSWACTGSGPVTCAAEDTVTSLGPVRLPLSLFRHPLLRTVRQRSEGTSAPIRMGARAGACTGPAPSPVSRGTSARRGWQSFLERGLAQVRLLSNGGAGSDGYVCTQGDPCKSGVRTGSYRCRLAREANVCHIWLQMQPGHRAPAPMVAANGTSCSDGMCATPECTRARMEARSGANQVTRAVRDAMTCRWQMYLSTVPARTGSAAKRHDMQRRKRMHRDRRTLCQNGTRHWVERGDLCRGGRVVMLSGT